MLARCLTTILPEMTLAEAIDTTCIPHFAGGTGGRTAVVTSWPWRAAHHTCHRPATPSAAFQEAPPAIIIRAWRSAVFRAAEDFRLTSDSARSTDNVSHRWTSGIPMAS
jgi:predicted ATPase with chaperone activity